MEVHDRAHIFIFWVIRGPSFQDIFVKLDDGLCKGVCDNLEEVRRLRSSSSLHEVVHHLGGCILQVPSRGQTSHDLHHNKDYHSQPVEHVMDCGCSKGSFKLSSKRIQIFVADISIKMYRESPIRGLCEADKGVGDTCTNVCPHDHWYCSPDWDICGHQAHNDGG